LDTLIGHTGFVGGNLIRQHGFGATFNRANIESLGDKNFDVTVCAAAPGSMFEANRFPEVDFSQVVGLQSSLEKLTTHRFVLISSIAVLEDFSAGDVETTDQFQKGLAYGRNRRNLEVFALNHFDKPLIVRLPALFGYGLRKNFLFDILNPAPSMLTPTAFEDIKEKAHSHQDTLEKVYSWDASKAMHIIDREALLAEEGGRELEQTLVDLGLSATRFTNPQSTFQFYNLSNLWVDICRGIEDDLDILHLCPEPVLAGDIYKLATGSTMPDAGARVHHEDMRTRYANFPNSYTANRDEVLRDVGAFLKGGQRS
jgi:hypothetical protein